MKKLFVILSMLVALAFAGCATTKSSFNHNKAPDVYIDPDYTWANNYPVGVMFGPRSSLRAITVRVVNKKYTDVRVRVRCDFSPQKSLNLKLSSGTNVHIEYQDPDAHMFGEMERIVKARGDRTFMVYGFARLVPDNETVSCSIKSVR